MKKSVLLLTLLCVFAFVFLAACFSSSGASFEELVAVQNTQRIAALKELVGTWEGSYYATQGETGLTLDVQEENGKYRAIFRFYNLPGKTNVEAGSYRMGVSYILAKGTTKKYDLNFREWIEQPSGYGSLDLSGMLDGDVFNGKTNYGDDFNLVRKKHIATANNVQPTECTNNNPETHFCDTRDNKKYKIVKIGEQTWMAENLNYDAEVSFCYGNKFANSNEYGRLYDWKTAMAVCPKGWHLPSKNEYEALDKAVGGEKVAGKKLKATSGWSYDGNGTDDYGFSALPGGFGDSGGARFGNVSNNGYWWSSSNEDNSDYTYYRDMDYGNENVNWGSHGKSYMFSVRCVKD